MSICSALWIAWIASRHFGHTSSIVSCSTPHTSHSESKTVREEESERNEDGVGNERTWLWPKNAVAHAPGVLCVVGIIHRKGIECVRWASGREPVDTSVSRSPVPYLLMF